MNPSHGNLQNQGRPAEEIIRELRSFVIEARPGNHAVWRKLDNLGAHSGGLVKTLFEQPFRFIHLLNRGENRAPNSDITNLSLYWFHRRCGTCAIFGDTGGQERWVERMDDFFAFLNGPLPERKMENDIFGTRDWFSNYGDIHLLLDVYRTLRQSWNTRNMLSSDASLFIDKNGKSCSPAVARVDDELRADLLDRLAVLSTIASAMTPVGMALFFRTFQTGTKLGRPTQSLHQWFQPIRTPSSLTPDMADVLRKTLDLVNWDGGLAQDLPGRFPPTHPGADMWHTTCDERSRKLVFTRWKNTLEKHLLTRMAERICEPSDVVCTTAEESINSGSAASTPLSIPGGVRPRKL